MWRLRLLLLPFTAIIELLIFVACYIMSVFSLKVAKHIIKKALRILPPLRWYIGE